MTDAERIMTEALDLPVEDRTEIALRLLETVDAPDSHGHMTDAELVAEIRRRVDQLDSGAVQGVPWEKVRAQLRPGGEAPDDGLGELFHPVVQLLQNNSASG